MEEVTLKVIITAEHGAKLQALSEARGISVSQLIEELIDEASQ
jgi:hypothetical protein